MVRSQTAANKTQSALKDETRYRKKISPDKLLLFKHSVLLPVLYDRLAVQPGLQHAVQSLADIEGSGAAVAVGQGMGFRLGQEIGGREVRGRVGKQRGGRGRAGVERRGGGQCRDEGGHRQ